MTAGGQILWFLGLAALLVWVGHAVRAARHQPHAVVARSRVVGAALLVAGLGSAGGYLWGVEFARAGLSRILAAGEQAVASEDAPARARLFLRTVQLLLPRSPDSGGEAAPGSYGTTVGFSPDAGLRLPRSYGVQESKRGWDVIRVRALGPQRLSVVATESPEPTDTRIFLESQPRRTLPPTGRAAQRACARAAKPMAAVEIDGADAVHAVICAGTRPRAALVFERDLRPAHPQEAAPVRVTPLVWAGRHWRPHHIQISSGSLLQIGTSSDALPGVMLWEVPAPVGRAELFFPPDNLLADCSSWAAVGAPELAEGVGGSRGGQTIGKGSVCVLPFAAPFGLEVRRLLPDLPGITARSAWGVCVLLVPALVLLCGLCTRRRSELTRARFATAIVHGWLAVVLASIGVWRLLWAHRIDMLRSYETVGVRVLQNQVLLVLAGATMAAAAAASWWKPRCLRRALIGAVTAWFVWLLLGGYALRADLSQLSWDARLWGQLAVSVVVGTAPVWGQLVPARWTARWSVSVLASVAVAILCLVVGALMPRVVALKLGLAWAAVLLLYTALQASGQTGALLGRRAVVTFAVGAAVAAAAAVLDAGVSAVILLPGMVVALVFWAHDALFGGDAVRYMSSYRLHHAPLVLAHAMIILLLGVGLTLWGAIGLRVAAEGQPDGELARSVTFAALHLPAVVAALFVPVAVVAYRRGALRAAMPWITASVLLLSAWAVRAPALDRVLGARPQAADRIALVADPGYALLRSETKFVAGITAWREAIIPGENPDLLDGQGYFGAQLIDPGVLLSVENDYFPVLLLREGGTRGLLAVAVVLLQLVFGLWWIAGARFRHGSYGQRVRMLAVCCLGVVCVYQPLAALGVLPLTGISWPGFGLDSPSDFWILLAVTLWVAASGDDRNEPAELERLDADLRQSRLFRRVSRWAVAAALVLAVACTLLVGRAAVFALQRPNPVDERGRVAPPFEGMEAAVDYAYQLQCPWTKQDSEDPEDLVPTSLLAEPRGSGPLRFHRGLLEQWRQDRGAAVQVARRYLAGEAAACSGGSGRWSFQRKGGAAGEGESSTGARCHMRFKAGWPEAVVTVARDAAGRGQAQCEVSVDTAVLRQLRLPVRRPYRNARIRLVSRAMGRAAQDGGELISGQVVVRLRRGAGELDVSSARAGSYLAERVVIAEHLRVDLEESGAVLHYRPSPDPGGFEPLMFVRDQPAVPIPQLAHPEGQSWRLVARRAGAQPMDRMAVVAVGGPRARSLWLFRPAQDPLLADDVSTVAGERRRYYTYGGLLPELGWVNPYSHRLSLGLDGWVRVAMASYERGSTQKSSLRWSDGDSERAYCGTLEPPVELADERVARVCAVSPLDGVLECRVSVQPELAIQLRHLTELISLRPEQFVGTKRARKVNRPVRAGYVLMRGDTGELVAQGEFVPGRASSAYAPSTPELEQYLIRLREDRDPRTGRKLPRAARGEASAEKVQWAQPVAVGSTLKPLLARALELADPEFARGLVLSGSRFAAAQCRGRRPRHALLGHCPPTDSLWNHEGTVSMGQFIAASVNWYHAAIGLAGTAAGGGSWGIGDDSQPRTTGELLASNVGAYSPGAALWTRYRGAEVISARGSVDPFALRDTAMWRRFEQVIGRPLCVLGSKWACRRDAARKDLCAARALPIQEPSRDLRHLVALGPSSFNFYPELRDPTREVLQVPTREYFQFLRGSGLHPVGSLAQLTDAFNRVVFEPNPRGPNGAFTLAASWFPVPAVGRAPDSTCAELAADDTVASGLCEVVRGGTAAAALGPLLTDPRFEIYGAKTGTIDSMADIAEQPEACEAFRVGHTIADAAQTSARQPYWLDCKRHATGAVNDSLLVVSFGVHTGDGVVPLTLGLRFQRGGLGLASATAAHYLALIGDYFAGSSDAG